MSETPYIADLVLSGGTIVTGKTRYHADVAKMTVYVVDLTPEKMGGFGEGAMRAAMALGQVTPAITLIGVTALGEPDLLVEVEATAVLP